MQDTLEIGQRFNSVEVCKACHDTGTLLRLVKQDFTLYEPDPIVPARYMHNDTERVPCWICRGAKRWRRSGASWTKFKDLPHWAVEEVIRYKHFLVMDSETGKVCFIAPPLLGMFPPNELISIMKIVSKLGKCLESHGWMVEY